jgi:hypothetical protein
MRQTISVTSRLTSIVVVRGSFEKYFSTEEKEVTAFDHGEGQSLVTGESRPTVLMATEVDDWLKFQSLVADWRTQRGAISSITESALCPAYQSIIGMGDTAVPFILSQLESEGEEPDQWFWALKAITGEDPVQNEDRGDFVAMAKSWLEWAKRNADAW